MVAESVGVGRGVAIPPSTLVDLEGLEVDRRGGDLDAPRGDPRGRSRRSRRFLDGRSIGVEFERLEVEVEAISTRRPSGSGVDLDAISTRLEAAAALARASVPLARVFI